MIVLMGCEVKWKQRPVNCSVIGRRELPAWFLKMPRQMITPGEILELERVARTPSTWVPNPKHSRASRGRRPTATAPPPKMPGESELEFVINRWRKFGHDRLYANLPDGEKVGWIDVVTGQVRVENQAQAESVRAALRRAWAALGPPEH